MHDNPKKIKITMDFICDESANKFLGFIVSYQHKNHCNSQLKTNDLRE